MLRGRGWWTVVVEAMIRGRCCRRKKMMGGGANGGCGTEEKPCPISRVPVPVTEIGDIKVIEKQKQPILGVDLYSQARKALAERCPFDYEVVQVSTPHTLSSELSSYLAKKSDSRKRHKKSHTGADTKNKSSSRPEKARGRNIWVETEEYFRGLNGDDIDKLYQVSSLRHLACRKHFVIQSIGNVNAEAANDLKDDTRVAIDSGIAAKDRWIDAKEEEVMHLMEVDSVGASELPPKEEREKCCSLPQQCSGVEWLLGSRTKIYLASERPSKKRKLLGGVAGLEKLFVACPVKEASSSLCHYCSQGDTGDQLNRLIVCSSCGVAIHQRCYGVQNDETDCWLCSWCRQHKKESKSIDKPCVLCPQHGGALKPLRKSGFGNDNDVSWEFAHLFCCQWMPEVYIEDTRTMEPILNVEGIKDIRRKLICYLCKAKCGACVRCSSGACRTSFHPICAREASHRMEIWGKLGYDDVELRAFCAKHSEVPNSSSIQQLGDLSVVPVGSGSSVTSHQLEDVTFKKPHMLKIGRRNGDKGALHMETPDTKSCKLGDSASLEAGLLDTSSNSRCGQLSDEDLQFINRKKMKKNGAEDNMQEARNLTRFLKQLIDRRKVDAKEVASDIGVTADTLASTFVDGRMIPGLYCKIVNWLSNHDQLPVLQKSLKVKFKSKLLSKFEMGAGDHKDTILASEPKVTDVLSVRSVPPRRRTKSNINILKDSKIICSSKRSPGDDGVVMDTVREVHSLEENSDFRIRESHPDAEEKVSVESFGVSNTSPRSSSKYEGDPAKSLNLILSDSGQADTTVFSDWNSMVNSNLGNPACSVSIDQFSSAIGCKSLSDPYIHPLFHNKVLQMQNLSLSGARNLDDDGLRDGEVCTLEASSSSDICCNRQSLTSSEFRSKVNPEHSVQAKNMIILDLSPGDEVEGELVYYQHRLLCNAVARRRCSDELILRVIKSLPQEIDALRARKWDAVLVSRYLCELREAKKQGRKERRHKEAQAVLAAATAVAAASSRISSFRKDAIDDSASQEANMLKVNPPGGRGGLYAQQMPRAKETFPRLAVPQVSSERNSDSLQSTLKFFEEHSRTCDICRRVETILNPILVCSGCKVTVHLDCYRSVKESSGPWYCELCEDPSSSRSLGASTLNCWEKPSLMAECYLCGGTAGAFRKSTDGQWIHAFCAEWVLEPTFRRGQVNPIEGVETITKGREFCLVCSRKQGVCVKCNYGHCQSTFHPACARSAGFYMNMRTTGGKLQRKAYCEKHSLVERAKTETQKHGNEEMNILKKVRVELERLRLICERIIKREKLKRELVVCSLDMLHSNRDVIVSTSSFFPTHDVSSESESTSLKDGYKSGESDALIQQSDDVTVDSTVACKQRIRYPMDHDDQKTDVSSTSQLFVQKPPSFSGKQIPRKPSQSTSDDGQKPSKYKKHTETFKKEVVMTSDQASMRNQRLPKGFVYVPIDCLSNVKEVVGGAKSSHENSQQNG